MSERLYFASRPFSYGPPDSKGDALTAGQVVALGGYPGDHRLVDLGLLREVDKRTTLVACGKCGARFVTDALLHMHGNRNHAGLDPVAAEHAAVAEDKKLEKMMPLHMDRTEASRGIKPDRRRRAS